MMKPIFVKGKCNEAKVFAKALEANCENRIKQYLDLSLFSDTKVRIMPDVHFGKGTVVGWTATYGSYIIPSVIGTDIGCGLCACKLDKGKMSFDKLDAFIRKRIPSGPNVHPFFNEDSVLLNDAFEKIKTDINQDFSLDIFKAEQLKNAIFEYGEKQGFNPQRVLNSLGTLGGGNHFIEIDVDEKQNRWLLIHSGSRSLGASTAQYHDAIAVKETDTSNPIKYLTGTYADDYLSDLRFVQYYARLNRTLMAQTIVKEFFKLNINEAESFDCVHNYIDIQAKIIRKGAISAKNGEKVIIPFSMSEGAAIGIGKGNADWNYSAPHGSGRKKPVQMPAIFPLMSTVRRCVVYGPALSEKTHWRKAPWHIGSPEMCWTLLGRR